MKKLKLKAIELGAEEVLSREQLKNVLGGGDDDGSGEGSGTTTCSESCGSGANVVNCTSSTGDCSRDTTPNSAHPWIKCDGKKYDCPTS